MPRGVKVQHEVHPRIHPSCNAYLSGRLAKSILQVGITKACEVDALWGVLHLIQGI